MTKVKRKNTEKNSNETNDSCDSIYYVKTIPITLTHTWTLNMNMNMNGMGMDSMEWMQQ